MKKIKRTKTKKLTNLPTKTKPTKKLNLPTKTKQRIRENEKKKILNS
jgi:hypothetical protein